jgi:hypothetical protein
MADQPHPPAVDPDNITETLCIGCFNMTRGPGPLVTLTFTNARPKPGPMIDNSQLEYQSVVRARIVTSVENLVALRDMLVSSVHEHPTTAGGGGYKLN